MILTGQAVKDGQVKVLKLQLSSHSAYLSHKNLLIGVCIPTYQVQPNLQY